MTRDERRELVSQLVTQGDHVDTIMETVAGQAGVQPDTVRKDIVELFPNLLKEEETDELELAKLEIKRLEAALAVRPKTSEKAAKPLTTTKQAEDEYASLTVIQIAFDQNDGSLMSKPFTHTLNRREWPRFIAGHRDNGVTVLSVDKVPTGLKSFDPDAFYKQFKDRTGVSVEDNARTRAIKELGL